MPDGRTRGTLAQGVSARHRQNFPGLRIDQAGSHRVLGDLGRRRLAGQEHPEGGLVQMGVLRRHLVVHRQANQVMAECGPAVSGFHHQARPDQGLERVSRFGRLQSSDFGGHLGTKAGTEHARGPQVSLPSRTHAGKTGQEEPAGPGPPGPPPVIGQGSARLQLGGHMDQKQRVAAARRHRSLDVLGAGPVADSLPE